MRAGWAEFARRHRPLLIAAPLVLAVLSVIVFRVQIGERLVPDSRMNRQLELAQRALRRGELTRADGRGARELFEAALAIDPDQSAARDGLQQVRDAAIARAELSLREHKLPLARQDIDSTTNRTMSSMLVPTNNPTAAATVAGAVGIDDDPTGCRRDNQLAPDRACDQTAR